MNVAWIRLAATRMTITSADVIVTSADVIVIGSVK